MNLLNAVRNHPRFPIRWSTVYGGDDFIGQGGTLANLRGHVIEGGANVVAAATLTGKAYSAKLALSKDTLTHLRAKHGRELENWWTEVFGYDFEECVRRANELLNVHGTAFAAEDRNSRIGRVGSPA